MTAPTIAETLKYANLQMAAEALYDFNTKKCDPFSLTPGDHYTGAIRQDILTDGNEHASRFAPTEADKFVTQWKVVDHLSNTKTGFSGTLFQARVDDIAQGIKVGDLVLSLRSTEFIDDAIRDGLATNSMEIDDYGFAFGQIDDMEKWYAQLSKAGGPLAGQHFSVTGYSLGGHLATAFNLLRREDGSIGNVDQVVTFNGAGVGEVTSGTLGNVIQHFNDLRTHPEKIATLFSDARLGTLYNTLRGFISDGQKPTAAYYSWLNGVTPQLGDEDYKQKRFNIEKRFIEQALDRISKINQAVGNLQDINDTDQGQPASIPDTLIAQESFTYQMAVLWTQEFKTRSMSKLGGAYNIAAGKSEGSPLLSNQYDIVGRETTTRELAMVANSQWHHGTNVDVFIEDQPLLRGSVLAASAKSLWNTGGLLPLNQYTKNDFGDTHSLVLLVDSLSVQNTLLQLLPENQRAAGAATLNSILRAASCAKAEFASGTQGRAEGDVLENMLDALTQVFTKTDPKLREGKASNGDSLTTGNTWADPALRKTFHEQLAKLQRHEGQRH